MPGGMDIKVVFEGDLELVVNQSGGVHPAVDDKAGVCESFGFALVEGGDVEYFESVCSIGKGIGPVSKGDFLILRYFCVKTDNRLGKDPSESAELGLAAVDLDIGHAVGVEVLAVNHHLLQLFVGFNGRLVCQAFDVDGCDGPHLDTGGFEWVELFALGASGVGGKCFLALGLGGACGWNRGEKLAVLF